MARLKKPDRRFSPAWSAIAVLALAAAGLPPLGGAEVVLPSGEPDATCPDLRLWLRADAGVRDAAGRSPSDPDFSGLAAIWGDQSPRHFDVAALPDKAPYYVMRQPGAGNRPTIAFGKGRMLGRTDGLLHDHVNSTTILVLQVLHPREWWGNVVFCAGKHDEGGKREVLSFEHGNDLDVGQGYVHWMSPAHNGELNLVDSLHVAADGRFAILMIRSAGEASSLEVQDGLGDTLGTSREMSPQGMAAVSEHCGQGYCLGGQKLDQRENGYDGQIAEVLVYNRALSSAERRRLVAYLRRKYQLDVLDALYPPGTQLLQAEDFDGDWQLNPRWDPLALKCLGQRHVTSKDQRRDDSIQRTVFISQPGNYSVWVRAVNLGRRGGLRTLVGGRSLGVTHGEGPIVLEWQLAGSLALPQGETEIVVLGQGQGPKECDAVLISPSVNTLDGVEQVCSLARRLQRTPSPCQVTALFDDGRRIDGNLVSGWRGSGTGIGHDGRPRPGLRCLRWQSPAPDASPRNDALFEFHNGDRMRGTISKHMAASPQPGELLVEPSQETDKSPQEPASIELDWLRRIVFDSGGPPGRCPPRSVVCRDGRMIAFRALRFSADGVSALTDRGLERLAYRDLAEVALQPIDAWEAYYRQLARIDPQAISGIVRLETEQGMVLTASGSRVMALREENEAAAAKLRVQPAWNRTPLPLAWSAVRCVWRAPASLVPLSLFPAEKVAQGGALGASWTWQADRNVAGGELRSGGVNCLWGLGVHAPNRLVFRLPASALAFRSGLGIDASMGDCGLAVGKVYVNEIAAGPLFQSQPLSGSRRAISTGEIALVRGGAAARALILAVDDGGAAGPQADPLDIGAHVDWLEPVLVLDPAKLRAAVAKYLK